MPAKSVHLRSENAPTGQNASFPPALENRTDGGETSLNKFKARTEVSP